MEVELISFSMKTHKQKRYLKKKEQSERGFMGGVFDDLNAKK